MTDPQLSQLDRLRRSMTVLESQRAALGDEAIDPALFALEQQIAALEDQQREDGGGTEDRRIVTILFTDIVDSTTIAAQLDPEDWRTIVAALHTMAGKTVQEHEGTVVQYLGDGLLALFGAHISSERDPERAIRTALAIQDNIHSLPIDLSIQLRIGVHTGLVVMGEMGSEAKREFTASGESMNFAARLQEASPPAGVLISHSTYRHVRGLFDMTLQSPFTLKGRSAPQQNYLVHHIKSRPYQIASRGVLGVETPTVGREAESLQLQRAYQDALKDKKMVWAQLVGVPGVGKSRLMADTIESLELQPQESVRLRAFALEGDAKQPFALVRRMWFDCFQIPEGAPRAKAEALWEQGIQSLLDQDSDEPAHALGLLLGLPFEESPHIGAMRHDPLQIKGRAFTVSRLLFDHLRSSGSLVISIEDLHWADPSSWEYLTQVVIGHEDGKEGALILATARPEWHPPEALHHHPGYVQIDLQPLDKGASYLLAAELLHRVELVPESVLALIAERSEGVPFFAEEIVNWFIDQRILDRSSDPWRFISTRFDQSPLPPTLQHLLFTRLNALDKPQQAVLQRGAVFGRSFWERGLSAMGVSPDEDVLHQLQQRGFIEAQPTSSFEGDREWRYQHKLMRDVAYESVLKRQRPDLHRAAGNWLETQACRSDRLDEMAGRIGEHADHAGEPSAAADWYLRAGRHARSQGALVEARQFFDRALELLPMSDRERRWHALLDRDEILGVLGETEERRIGITSLLRLAQDLEDPKRLAQAYYRQAVYFESLGDDHKALEISQSALRAARKADNLSLEMLILPLMLVCQTRLGELKVASELADELLLRSEGLEDESVLARILTNIAVHYTETGDIGMAVELGERQIEINHRLGDRVGEAIGLGNVGYNHLQLGQFDKGRDALEQSMKLNEALGARRVRAYNLLNLGLCDWRNGDTESAQQITQQVLTEFEAIGDAFGRGTSLSYMALALEHMGDVKGATQYFTQAREILTELGVRGFEYDTIAGLARCSLVSGSNHEAQKFATELWDYLTHYHAKGMEFPIWAYQTCATVFEAIGDDKKYQDIIEAGYQILMTHADKISNAELRKSYLDIVPEHRAMIEMWNRIAR